MQNCAADECSYGELRLIRITPSGTCDDNRAAILEALINDIPENRSLIWRAMERSMHQAATMIIDREQRGLGFFRVEDLRIIK